ncbi:MAG: glutaredoxin family protein [Gammaproteobacteria bacterium]
MTDSPKDLAFSTKKTRKRAGTPIWHWAVIFGAFFVVLNFSTLRDTVGGKIQYSAEAAGPVTLYSTSWCGYCKKVRRTLTKHEIPFQELDIEQNESANQTFQQLGGRGVPVVTIGDRVVHGYNYSRLRELLECADCE